MRGITLLALLFISFSAFCQSKKTSLFDTIYAYQKVQLVLTYPFDSLYKTNNQEITATATIRIDDNVLLDKAPISLNLRGKFRRMKCSMPPLMLNFKKSTLRQLNLSSSDEIKLVTHCIEGKEGELNLQEERMMYQVYESLTPNAYRSIWVEVSYCDKNTDGKCNHAVGFLLEPDKVISDRLNVKERKLYNVAEDSIDFNSYSLAVSYNYLIGNRDWSVKASRNAKLFFDVSIGKYIIIPYDFDYSNVVGASYRRETAPMHMKHPFDRIYEGEYFESRAGEIIKNFLQHEPVIQDRLKSAVSPLPGDRRQMISNYFRTWFDVIRKAKEADLKYGMICPYKNEFN